MNAVQMREIIVGLLAATYNTVGEDGLASAFILGRRDRHPALGGISVALFFRRKKLMPAVMKLRSLGPPHLRYLPLGHSFEKLRSFLTDRYHLVAGNNIFSRAETSLLERISKEQVDLLVDQFAESDILTPPLETCLFPLVTIQMRDAFEGAVFSLSTATGLAAQTPLANLPRGYVDGHLFPPFSDWKHKTQTPTSWLLVTAPSPEVAKKYRASILGAISLTVMHHYRHQFTGRKVFGGVVGVRDGWSFSDSSPHTPALGEDVVLGVEDGVWLEVIDRALASSSEADIKKLKSLQYFYRAWFLPDSERFPIDCITIDSMFGDANGATEAVARGVDELFGGKLDRTRVLLLMRLRNSVIHGGAPDVYDSSKYARYYRDYGDDPIADMSALVAECLRRKVFDGQLREQPDPYAEVIAQAVAAGRFPAREPAGILAPLATAAA
ncbi:hypothetical protein [Mesorhizobium sp. M7A.F.Ca.CA.004.04.2.1]|uniref:hypothetical protein n=1 Tax=Mesorhizobium sp. M7A.F.Ca.CA.004.04.2.1 TaxID=2496677 RepID=UPI000FD22C54|nr:hypothetical protein [Mesorhizobium sp. M7A.F.Ca.CA.004.04.2.1]RVC29578.1 hypothetical protein EN893_16610 [Mesorhizobium sp. M7A.F.Ca.CA.004.04.2.1]